jgi:hypothetical protein
MTHIAQYILAVVLATCVTLLALVILVDLWRTVHLFLTQSTERELGPGEPKGHNFLRGEGWRQSQRPGRRTKASVLTANLWKES